MNNAPKVTVFIPVYNAEKYLKECLDSILTQTFTDFELLLIDDGSTDGSAAIIAGISDSRIRYVKNEKNLGIARTRNRGLELARGEYIAFIDSDDISVPQRLEKQVAFMDANPQVGICGGWVQELYPDGTLIKGELRQYPAGDAEIREMMYWNCPLWNPSVIMRKAVIDAHGIRHNTEFISASDFDLFVKIGKVSSMANLPEIMHLYRRHENQITSRRTFEANRNASLLRIGLILDEIKKHVPGITYDPVQGVVLAKLTNADYFERIRRVDEYLAQLGQSNDPAKKTAYKRLKHYLDTIWFNSLFHLPRYDMSVYNVLRKSKFFGYLPLQTRLLYGVKSLLGVKQTWIKNAKALLKGQKQPAWQ
jgi:glycosyltransferase involved in cell wall biosynthesis